MVASPINDAREAISWVASRATKGKAMRGFLSIVIGLIGTFWLALAGGYTVYWYDRRPADVPKPVEFHLLWIKKDIGFPLSLLAQKRAAVASYEDALNRASVHSAAVEVAYKAASTRADAAEHVAQAKIQTQIKTILKEVYVAIPPAVDRSYPLPVGLVRTYNESTGADLSGLSLDTGKLDDAASAVAASRFATIAVANNGICRSDQERLNALQTLIRSFQVVETGVK